MCTHLPNDIFECIREWHQLIVQIVFLAELNDSGLGKLEVVSGHGGE